jgi:hypothetical protein
MGNSRRFLNTSRQHLNISWDIAASTSTELWHYILWKPIRIGRISQSYALDTKALSVQEWQVPLQERRIHQRDCVTFPDLFT